MSPTDTTVPLVDVGSGIDRAAFIQALIDLRNFYETHPDAPLPGYDGRYYVSIRVPGATFGEKRAALDAIAGLLGATVVKRCGSLFAERPFGPLTLGAHLNDADYVTELIRARDQRLKDEARRAGMGLVPAQDGSAA